jgi:hypothetical protein
MKSSLSIIIAAVCACTAAVMSCSKKSKDAAASPVSFSKDIIPILRANCALNSGCHSGSANSGDNIDFDSSSAYSTMIKKSLVNTASPTASLVYVEVSSGVMPKAPYSHLSSIEITLILNWIKQGAANN